MTNAKNLPTHEVFSIREREGEKKAIWSRIGCGFKNRDDSITLFLDSVPLGGKVQVRVRMDKED